MKIIIIIKVPLVAFVISLLLSLRASAISIENSKSEPNIANP